MDGISTAAAVTVAGIALGASALVVGAWLARQRVAAAREQATRIGDEARHDAERQAHEIVVAAQDRALAAEDESAARGRELDDREAGIDDRERELTAKAAEVDAERGRLERRLRGVADKEKRAGDDADAAADRLAEATAALERIAGLTADQAKAELVDEIEADARKTAARLARKIEDEARETAERTAIQLVVDAAQGVSIADAVGSTIEFIELPSDEMKGRIIGREGRNIRAIEHATGIDVVVDDTPRAILISSFDPMRREIARVAIGQLLEDGRIHPARIEEIVEKVREEIDTIVEEIGTQAAFELGMSELHQKLVRRVGRMRFHVHFGSPLLQHAIEVAHLAAYMAEEIGADTEIVRRAALFHEIGRVDHDVSGHAVLASAELAGKYGESEDVVHAIQALHPDVEAKSIEAMLLDIANRVADNRPGARKPNLEIFIERLRRMEVLARSHDGVRAAFAVKAGKEIRVLLDAEAADDGRAHALSKEIAATLERELQYPGQIRVSVVRQTRAVTFAR